MISKRIKSSGIMSIRYNFNMIQKNLCLIRCLRSPRTRVNFLLNRRFTDG